MKFPKKVKVGPFVYSIKESADLLCEEDRVDGYVDFNKTIIEIDKNLSPDSKKLTLLHEIVHIVFEYNGYENDAENEKMTNFISYFLYDIIKNNKDLFQYIMNDEPPEK